MKKEGAGSEGTKPFPKKSVPHDAHTFGTGGKEYDVYALIDLASHITPREIEVSQLKDQVLAEPCWTDAAGNKFSSRDLLHAYGEFGSWAALLGAHPEWREHIEKVQIADYRHPILLLNGELVDGMHRLLRAIIEGVPSIPTRSFERLPDEALFHTRSSVQGG